MAEEQASGDQEIRTRNDNITRSPGSTESQVIKDVSWTTILNNFDQ